MQLAAGFLAAALAILAQPVMAAQPTAAAATFDIPAGALADALDRFSEQSGLQVVYDQTLIEGRQAPAVAGALPIRQALDLLLSRTQLMWDLVNDGTTVLVRAPYIDRRGIAPNRGPVDASTAHAADTEIVDLEKYITTGRIHDKVGLLPTEPVDSVFGIGKSLLETPRSVSMLNDELMAFYGIETALDVAKVVPGTYTASIFSINGNVNIRGVPSDTYFRGVKRLENTQMFPSPITAMSRLDVVRGPPSPIYGPGKIGGYTNFVPKSARASTGKYLERPTGKLMVTLGSFDKKAGAAELGGPITLRNRRGGYYVYANAEDSDTYYEHVPFEQYILQSSFDYEINSAARVEIGHMYQYWGGTELAGWNRLTQELVDTGMYSAGQVLTNMDRDGDGLISTAEIDSFGPLQREFTPGSSAKAVESSFGPGWEIDPSTVRRVKLRRTANAQSSEDGGSADVHLAYFDLILQLADGATLTNKTYFESMERSKWTRASAFGQDTRSSVFEEKLIYEKPFGRVTEHTKLSFNASTLYRHYDTRHLSGSKYNDLVNRADLSRPFDTRNRFAVPNLEPHLAPWNTGLESTYDTIGIGALLDGEYKETGLVLCARYDWLENVRSEIPQFVLTTPGLKAGGEDAGFSWSASVSHEVAPGVRPYVTYARQETLVHGMDGGIGIAVVANPLNTAELREAGLKASLFNETLFASAAGFRQTRTSFSATTLQVPSTLSRGWEVEVRWVPGKRAAFSGGGTWQTTTYQPLSAATILVEPSFFGVPDQYFGGRLQTTLVNDSRYAERSGYPDRVLSFNGTLFFREDLALNVTLSYQDEVPSGRMRDITLPDATLLGMALVYDTSKWSIRVAANNLTNELYFTPNSPDFSGQLLAIPAPERNYQMSVAFKL